MSNKPTFWFPEHLHSLASQNSRECNVTLSRYISQGVFLLETFEEYDIFPISTVIKNKDNIEVPLPIPYQDIDINNPIKVCLSFNKESISAQEKLIEKTAMERSTILRHATAFRNGIHEIVGQVFPLQIDDKDAGTSLAIIV